MGPLEIRDIKGMIPVQEGMAPLAFGGFIVLFLAGYLLVLWMKRRAKKALLPVPPHEIALKALVRLRQENIERGDGLKIYYDGISRILRDYLQNRFALSAPGMTTEECLRKVKKNPALSGETQRLVETLLEHCDLVRFSGRRPFPEETDRMMRMAESMIDMTKGSSAP